MVDMPDRTLRANAKTIAEIFGPTPKAREEIVRRASDPQCKVKLAIALTGMTDDLDIQTYTSELGEIPDSIRRGLMAQLIVTLADELTRSLGDVGTLAVLSMTENGATHAALHGPNVQGHPDPINAIERSFSSIADSLTDAFGHLPSMNEK